MVRAARKVSTVVRYGFRDDRINGKAFRVGFLMVLQLAGSISIRKLHQLLESHIIYFQAMEALRIVQAS